MYVGLQWAFERTARLIAFLRAELAATPGVEVVTQAPAAGIVTFRIGAWGADEAATELGRRVFAILRPLPELEALRASVAWFNTEDELARFTGAVREIAAHTPQTLPRRPSLVILPADGGSAS
jgi:selenocysteine lyase/cysteine desulfurase